MVGCLRLSFKNVNPKPKLTKTIHFKFKIGDSVRISHVRKPFDRDYDVQWTGEHFIVKSRLIKRTIPIYELQDINGEDVEGTFYEGELQKVTITDGTINAFTMAQFTRKEYMYFQAFLLYLPREYFILN